MAWVDSGAAPVHREAPDGVNSGRVAELRMISRVESSRGTKSSRHSAGEGEELRLLGWAKVWSGVVSQVWGAEQKLSSRMAWRRRERAGDWSRVWMAWSGLSCKAWRLGVSGWGRMARPVYI